MANIKNIPPSYNQSGGIGNEVLNQMLVELLRDLSLNKNIFTTDLSNTEDEEILEAYGYKLHDVVVKNEEGMSGKIPVALPSTLSDSEVKKVLKGIKTFDEAYLYYPKVVLERENRKLYVKLIKKLIHDCNS